MEAYAMSLMQPTRPIGATHVWYQRNGSFRAYLKVNDWVYCDTPTGWVAVAKHISSLHGKVDPL
jgi:hypothetical protein